MRFIQKLPQPPASLRDYLANQSAVGIGLDYRTFSQTASPNGGSRAGQLCRELIAEQAGLCAYTGAGSGVDQRDLFGAAHRGNEPVPIVPVDATCEQRFSFDSQGHIAPKNAADAPAVETIRVLNLNHEILQGWRQQAILVFAEGIESQADVERVIERTTNPTEGKLPEYCFAIRQVIQELFLPSP